MTTRTHSLFSRPAKAAPSVLTLLVTAQARWRQRRQLAELDQRLLDDMGLTRADIHRKTGLGR